MEFKSPYLPWLGVAVAIIWSVQFWHLWGGSTLGIGFTQGRSQLWRKSLRLVFFALGLVGWGLLAYSLSQPRTAQHYSPSSREVIDIMLVVDVSRSMLAEDLQPNRLEATKRQLQSFAAKRVTDRVGLVIFSEKVFTLMPLSTDPDLLSKVIGDIDIGYLGSGTNIGDGLGLGVARLQDSDAKNKVVVLLTDGVANVGNLTPLQAAGEAKKLGIKVYTIGVGTQNDARMPVGRSVFGTQYQMIPGGGIDYKTLREIATLTNAKFFPATDEKTLNNVFEEINNLERTEIKVDQQVVYDEHYYKYYVWGFMLLIIAELSRRIISREVA